MSDAPEIRDEARTAVGDATTGAAKAERLTRYVNALLEKKPTVSLPSARDVLRTRVGDCNEHTALYVAMARAVGYHAEDVTEPAEIIPALKRAFDENAKGRPAFLEFISSHHPVHGGWVGR